MDLCWNNSRDSKKPDTYYNFNVDFDEMRELIPFPVVCLDLAL